MYVVLFFAKVHFIRHFANYLPFFLFIKEKHISLQQIIKTYGKIYTNANSSV